MLAGWGDSREPSATNTMQIGVLTSKAPEMYRPGPDNYDHSSDVWSFGVVMLELVSGTRFLEENQGIITEYSEMERRFSDDREIELRVECIMNTSINPFLRDMIKKMMTFNPKDRPSLEALQHYLDAYQQIRHQIYNVHYVIDWTAAQKETALILLSYIQATDGLMNCHLLPEINQYVIGVLHLLTVRILASKGGNLSQLLSLSANVSTQIASYLNHLEELVHS